MKAVIIYYSRGGTTKKMAEIIHENVKKQGVDADIFSVEQIEADKLLEYDGIIIGSPTYYGTMAAEIKELLDKSVVFHGKLDGKVGGAFASSANLAGGNETTVFSILQGLLIHGIIIGGDPKGDHYGPVAVGSVDERCRQNCQRFASRFVDILKKVK
jgi:NAD(P)H dehydrogenase (quinone)